jgi:uncharacterized protein (DUF488 family)
MKLTFMRHPYFSIGHSTLAIEEFVGLLRDVDVTLVTDVRTAPRSRKNPQYNGDTLATSLQSFAVGYEHIPELGGLRSRRPVAPATNGFWQNERFHNYADYAMGEEFRKGLNKLMHLGQTRRCAIMCAEAVWWRCHRRIIADYLLADGETVIHILPKGRRQLAGITAAAVRRANGALVYPPASRIVGYQQDEEKSWIAVLSCGHRQHVRHRPPFVERPWVLTEAGRATKLGEPVVCSECARDLQSE